MTPEERLRAELQREAERVPRPPDRWNEIESQARRTRRDQMRNKMLVLGAAAAAVVALVLYLPGRGAEPVDRVVSEPTPSVTPALTPRPAPELRAGSLPLWPFGDGQEVADWQDSGGPEEEPWRLDAEQTALRFTSDYLGFTSIRRVAGRDIRDDEAWVAVGYPSEDGSRMITAADIHLLRFGSGPDAPWEVVGTRDTLLTLDTPRYGSTVTSPVTAGGRITGVDENINVAVRQLGSDRPLGTAPCCTPGGGERQPWQMSVRFTGATDGILTIVAWLDGHHEEVPVPRFAITGVRVG